ncbi:MULTISPECIES: DUF3592 domain-containing protein [Nostocales]|uniref:DUF3592 domain-containing protein n=3 Tax=Nostocales TaxID=1161 RepID=A0A8S9T971_9CYAN|nr:DUF3592 domain-containing protein [Tolypothrix bouteillei]KAF3888029.1 DUF3592 domain-containing protein [Tolypothrix bouteillei VB521301]
MRIPSLQTYNSILASTALTCIGILVTTVGITTGLNNYSFVKKAISTQGTVINNLHDSTKSSNSYYPLVKFTARTGETVVFESKVGSSSPKYTKGDRVEILYQPQKPNAAMINTWIHLWFFPIIFSTTGSLSVLIGAALLARELKQNKFLTFTNDQLTVTGDR